MEQMNMPMAYPTQAMPMRHAFCVVGTETIFLCHQIMSHMEGHNYEFVLEVELSKEVKKKILEDRLAGHSHFIANQEADLMTLAQLKSRNKLTFKADAWNAVPDKHNPPDAPWGDPEDPDVDPWLADFEVVVKRIVHYRHVNLNNPSRIHEQYIMFGKGEEAHIYHSIVWQPEYGHVASLKETPEWISPDQLEASIEISICDLPWRNDQTYCDLPLISGQKYAVQYFGINQYFDPDGAPMTKVPDYFIEIETTYWYSMWIVNYWNIPLCPNSPQICQPT
jgi:hypothetical protein